MDDKLKRHTIKVGETIGFIKILGRDSSNIKPYTRWECSCTKCGATFIARGQDIIERYQYSGCPQCLKNENLKKRYEYAESYIGKEYGALKVIGVDSFKWIHGAKRPVMRCLCSKCGNETMILLNRLKRGGALQCAKCAQKILPKGREIGALNNVEGTKISAIDGDRRLNKNNTSNHVGVSRMPSGSWRAYITFKRKQYYLGSFAKYEDAVKARENAEEKIYGGFLEWYQKAYPDQWEKIKTGRK